MMTLRLVVYVLFFLLALGMIILGTENPLISTE